MVPLSIAGIAKEVTTIICAAWFFGDELTPLNITGVAITIVGMCSPPMHCLPGSELVLRFLTVYVHRYRIIYLAQIQKVDGKERRA